MKLTKLCAAIDAAPTIYGITKFGPVAMQKGSFKEAMRRHLEKNDETGLKLNAEGHIVTDEDPDED